MDNVDLAKESIEKTHHHAEAPSVDGWSIKSAMLIAALAATAVLAEMSANDAQTGYLAGHIAASDVWNQYQAKSIRRAVYLQTADILAASNARPERIQESRLQAARMASDPKGDGMEQLAKRAKEFESERDHDLHLFNGLERGVRGLQIAIVLTSLCIATHMRLLVIASGVLGAVSAIYALLVGVGIA